MTSNAVTWVVYDRDHDAVPPDPIEPLDSGPWELVGAAIRPGLLVWYWEKVGPKVVPRASREDLLLWAKLARARGLLSGLLAEKGLRDTKQYEEIEGVLYATSSTPPRNATKLGIDRALDAVKAKEREWRN